jgi:hypothetical protein
MKRYLPVAALAIVCAAFLSVSAVSNAAAVPAALTGKYIEARTCDVWTGPCYANAEMNLSGKNAVLGWKVDSGSFDRVKLDGLGVVAVIAAHDTLGLEQTGQAKAVLIVDSRANTAQREALVHLAKKQGGELVRHIVQVVSARIDFDLCPCDEGGCAKLSAGAAHIETRCVNAQHDKVCGNESAFYPPLASGVKVRPAIAVEHSYTGKGIGTRWNDAGRRGAYLGSFEVR